MQVLEFKFALELFLAALVVEFFDFCDERLHVLFVLLYLLVVLAQLQVGVEQQLEECSDASTGAFKSLHIGEDHRVD